MTSSRPSTHQKALQLNLEASHYGTLAEIGGGQEVARWFFRAGHAAGTVAKSISAYDMSVSDALYGRATRYVSRGRLQAMLGHELSQLVARLDEKRGAETRFFAFANTVATRRADRPGPGDGWLGIRFQHAPRAEPSEVLLHASLLDRVRLHEQETLGIVGVNLIWGALRLADDPTTLVSSLVDELGRERIEVDVIEFSGPAFARVDNRLMSLQLVEQELCDAAMFTPDGHVVEPGEVLWHRPVLVERGAFRPVTHLTVDILESALAVFARDPEVAGDEVVVLMEMTLRDLVGTADDSHADFLARADLLGALGRPVLISRHARHFALVESLSRYTSRPIGVALGLPSLQRLGDSRWYDDLPGGLLEATGRLFRRNVRVFVHPMRDPETGATRGLDSLRLENDVDALISYLVRRGQLVPIRECHEPSLEADGDEVLARIEAGDESWQELVPEAVAAIIRQKGLFGWKPPAG